MNHKTRPLKKRLVAVYKYAIPWLLRLGITTCFILPNACLSPEEECAGNIEVNCDENGCFCGIGEFEGESCVDEPNSTDPNACENLCCGVGEGTGGPPSYLKGTK